MPGSITLTGRLYDESTLLAVAARLPAGDRRPPQAAAARTIPGSGVKLPVRFRDNAFSCEGCSLGSPGGSPSRSGLGLFARKTASIGITGNDLAAGDRSKCSPGETGDEFLTKR